MKQTLLPIARIRDYEFLGLYKPKEDSELFFYVYDIELDNNITERIFHSSVHNQVLMKGDIVEYEYNSKNNLVVRIPKKKPTYISHEKPTVKELLEKRKQRHENNQNK
jgi:hypothetical protein